MISYRWHLTLTKWTMDTTYGHMVHIRWGTMTVCFAVPIPKEMNGTVSSWHGDKYVNEDLVDNGASCNTII
jgi:hypothetical protein